eukprot:2445193-Rhodomonas_salina.1
MPRSLAGSFARSLAFLVRSLALAVNQATDVSGASLVTVARGDQARSAVEATYDTAAAKKTQEEFAYNMPVVSQVTSAVYAARGNNDKAKEIQVQSAIEPRARFAMPASD